MILIFFLIATYLFVRRHILILHVRGNSLYPVMSPNDTVVILRTRILNFISRNQMVLINLSNTGSSLIDEDNQYIKLVAGLPNDIVETPLKDKSQTSKQVKIPPDFIYVVGMTKDSIDSNTWGPIPVTCIVGVVIFSFRRSSVNISTLVQKGIDDDYQI